jgi:uncharacterized membrane protein
MKHSLLFIFFICSFALDTLLARMGYPFTTWQYWVIIGLMVVIALTGGKYFNENS